MKYEIQMTGYNPQVIKLPIADEDDNPFEIVELFAANEALANALNGGDADENGWIAGNVGGEDFQIRDSFHS